MNTATLSVYRQHVGRLALLISSVLTVMYGFTTSSQSVHYADASDLLLAATFGGLAHPPGYPLYVWLLHLFIVAFPQISPSLLGGLFAAGCMGIVSGLLIVVMAGLTHRLFNRRLWWGFAVLFVLLWALVPFQWTLASVPEIMPLSLMLLLAVFLCCLEPLQKLGTVPRYARWCGFIGTIACLYHPLLIGIVGWVWMVWVVYWRRSFRSWWFDWACGLLAGLLVTGLLYAGLVRLGGWYSWEVPTTLASWWHFWSRQIYTSSGSAIETLSRDWHIRSVFDALVLWGRWWNSEQYGWALSMCAVVGLGLLVVTKKMKWFVIMVMPILVYGFGLATYLKHPAAYSLPETALWWGIALRERMFYVLPLLLVLPASVIGGYLTEAKKSLIRPLRIGSWLMILMLLWFLGSSFLLRITPADNAASVYMKQLLISLPANATLLVDDDDVFGLLYVQSILSLRQDVVTIPVGMILMPQWWSTFGTTFSQHGPSSDKEAFITDMVETALDANRRIFLYGVDASVLEHLGVEGNPFFARPYGYTLEITAVPFTGIPPTEYGLSVQVAAIKTENTDNWFKGFRTHLGTIHAQQAYFLARMGFEKEAFWHASVASDLFYTKESKLEVSAILTEGTKRYTEFGSYAVR